MAQEIGDEKFKFLIGPASAILVIAFVAGLFESVLTMPRALAIALFTGGSIAVRMWRKRRRGRNGFPIVLAGQPFVLVLRPFARERRQRLFWTSVNHSVAATIQRTVRPIGRTVALASDGPTIFPVITASDDAWEGIVKRLIDEAAAIVLVPDVAPGLLTEVGMLRGPEILRKTLVCFPGGMEGDDGFSPYWAVLTFLPPGAALHLPPNLGNARTVRFDERGEPLLYGGETFADSLASAVEGHLLQGRPARAAP